MLRNNKAKRNGLTRLLALFASAALLMSGLAFPPAVQANPGDPFPEGNAIIFVAQTGSATNNTGTQLYEALQGKNSMVNISPTGAIDPISYNAMGFNQNDMYLYAIEVGNASKPVIAYNNLVRIGQDGKATVLGPISGLPNAAPGYNTGEMGGVGTAYENILFVRAGSSSAPDTSYMWLVDVTTRVATRVTLSKTVPNTADLFWYAGYLWTFDGASSTSGTAVQTVDRISPTGTVDRFTIGNLVAVDSYGAQWIYGSGMVGILGNQTGKLYQIIIGNPTSAAPTFTVVNTLSGPTTNGNDGAAYPGEPVDLGITKTAPTTFNPGSTLTYTLTIRNNDPQVTATGYIVTDNLPAGLLSPTTLTDGASISMVGGVNVLRYVGAPLAPGEILTITVSGATSATSMSPISNTASVDGNENDLNTDNNTDTVISTPQVTALQANPDTNHTSVGMPVSGKALANDTGDAIAVTAHTSPAHGSVTIGADGTYLYTPAGGFTGSDTFQYTITDSHGASSMTTVTITVDPLPDAIDDTNRTSLNTAASGNVLSNDTGARITVTANTQPSHGGVTVAPDGAYTYTPAGGFTGSDTFQYTITDENGKTDVATVTITVNALPKANDDRVTTSVNTPASGKVLSNDTGARITVTDNTQPSHGRVTVAPDGAYAYTPDAGYTGLDSFLYTITDENGKTSTATVSITVDPLPRAVADTNRTTVGMPVSGDVLDNDTGAGITVTSNTQPSHGTVAVAPDGSYTYTPVVGYTGPDSFVYTITDENGKTSTTTVTLAVDPLPLAVPDVYHTSVNAPASGNVLTNDTGRGVTVTGSTQPSHGTVTVNPDGRFVYTPGTDFTGTDTFTYTITDQNGKTSTTTVTVLVDDFPQANDDMNHTTVGTPVSGNALDNDSGNTIHVTSNTPPSHGQVLLDATGVYTYRPTAGYIGPDSFSYTIIDVNGNTTSATVYLTVDPLPDAFDDTNHTSVNTPVSGNVLANDTGVALLVTSNTQPTHGKLTVEPDGAYTYTPAGGYTGADTFLYTITDENGKTDVALVTITTDSLPDAEPDQATTSVNDPVSGDALENDTGEDIRVTGSTPPAHGRVAIDPEGHYTYTPDPGYIGPDSFIYTITDELGKTSMATVMLTVDPLPDAEPDTAETEPGKPVTGNDLSNDTGMGIRVTDYTRPSHGKVTIDPDGTYTYTPDPGFAGPDVFAYTIIDENGEVATALVTVNVKVAYTISYVFKKGDVETTITVVPGTVTAATGKVGAAVTPTGATVAANRPAGATPGSALDAPFVLSADADSNNFVVEYVDTPPEIEVQRTTIYVQKGVTLTLDQILAIADVSIVDDEETIPFSWLEATGYDGIEWDQVNYPGTGYVLNLEVADTPGLEAPIQQIAVYVEPQNASIEDQNPDPDYPIEVLPDGTEVGTDAAGDPVIYVPRKAAPTVVTTPTAAPKPVAAAPKTPTAGLPKTGDVISVTFPMIAALAAVALFLFVCARRKGEEGEQA